MKKKDIVDLINAKEIIKKNSNLLKPIKTDDGYLPQITHSYCDPKVSRCFSLTS